jgi:integrase
MNCLFVLLHRFRTSTEDTLSACDRLHNTRLGDKAVADVTTGDIEQMINAIGRSGHRPRANRVRALCSTLFNRALRKRHLRPDNPVLGVARFREEARERYLTANETIALMKALDEHRNQCIANAIRLLYWTGARRGEVLAATWDEFNLDVGTWTKPSAHTKQKRNQTMPLNSAALMLLRELKAKARPDAVYVFSGDDRAEPLKDIKKSWAQIIRRAEIENLRLHDLRHSFASGLLARGVGLEVIGGLLGHTRTETTQRYAHLLTDTLREATERLTQALPAPVAAK